MYVIRIDQGDYLECRGGYDWGRTVKGYATLFDSESQARQEADRLGIANLVRAVEPAFS